MRIGKSKRQADRPGSTGLRPARRTASSRVVAPPRIRRAPAKRIAVSFRDLMSARSAEERLALLRAGNIPAGVIQEAGEELQVPTTTLASALGIPRSTLHQWKADNAPLPSPLAEATMRLAEFTRLSREAFGDRDLGAKWLATRNAALAGERPLDLLATSYGGDIVRRALAVIEYGGVA